MTRVLAVSLLCLAACGEEPGATPDDPSVEATPGDEPAIHDPAIQDPASGEPGCALADGPIAYEGRAPAVAPGAVVVHRNTASGGEEAFLHWIDAPGSSPVSLGALRVPPRGLARREDGWLLAIAQTDGGPAALWFDADGREAARAPLAASARMVDGALAVAGDRGWAAWRDAGGSLWLSVIDRLARRVESTHELADAPLGAPLAAATRRRGHVSVAAPHAPLWTVPADGAPERGVAPGTPHDLLTDAGSLAVIHGSADRTGAWLARRGGASVRATHPRAQPEATVAAPLSDGALVVYRSRGDLWAQRADATGIRGEPVVIGRASGHPRLATRGSQLWVAWDDSERTQVRAGVCLPLE